MKLSSLKSFSIDVILLKITCLAWIIAKIMSFKLWTADRFFPVISPIDIISVHNNVHLFLYLSSLVAMASIIFFPNKKIIFLVVILEILTCLLDYMRWQPWEYQYLLTLVFFAFAKDRKQFLSLFIFLIGCTYIFSGAHKFDGSFLYTFWDATILRKIMHLDNAAIKLPLIHYSGLVLCFIEVFMGMGLLFFRKKKYVCVTAILMHQMIILLYGPTGMNYNLIIVPWNIAMLLFALVLFNQKEGMVINRNFFKSKFNLAVVILIGILPMLSFFGKWDDYLSFNLYSGNTKILAICVTDTKQYPELNRYTSTIKNNKYCDNAYIIKTNEWAMDELNVPVVPEERVFNKVQFYFNQHYPNLPNTFVCYRYPYKKENIIPLP